MSANYPQNKRGTATGRPNYTRRVVRAGQKVSASATAEDRRTLEYLIERLDGLVEVRDAANPGTSESDGDEVAPPPDDLTYVEIKRIVSSGTIPIKDSGDTEIGTVSVDRVVELYMARLSDGRIERWILAPPAFPT